MNRREFIKASMLGVAGLAARRGGAAGALPQRRPNVVMIMADDVGYECFSSYGSRQYSTPRLDKLAGGGVRFTNCHSTPLCTPSRVNLMSGKSNVFNYKDFGVYPKGEPTFGQLFKKAGYATAVAGKWQLRTKTAGITPSEAGFDSSCVWNTPRTARSRYWNPSLQKNGKLLDAAKGAYGPDLCTDFLIEFIKANRDRPFLAYYPMILVHNPFLTTPHSKGGDGKGPQKNFEDMVNYMDTCVGRIVDALAELKLTDDTIVIFTGDNGTNGVIRSRLGGETIAGGKGYTRDHGTHVPLIVSAPGRVPPGKVNEDLVCFSDFAPTMLDACGLAPLAGDQYRGGSFWPQCRGKPGTKRRYIYCYYFPRPYSKRFDGKYSHWEVSFVRDKRYKLYSTGKMYDTVADVLEKTPLAAAGDERLATVRKRLQSELDKWPPRGKMTDRSRVKGVAPKPRKRVK